MHDGGAGGAAPPWGRRSSPSYGPRSGKIWVFDWSRGQFHEKTSTTILQSHRQTELIIAYRFALCVYLIFI